MKFFAWVLLVVAGSDIFGQSGSDKLTQRLNIGVSAGIGGPHAFGVAPALELKLYRVSLRLSPPIQLPVHFGAGVEAELDVLRLPSTENYFRELTLAVGYNYLDSWYDNGDYYVYTEMPYIAAGFKKYSKSGRHLFSFKVGVGWAETIEEWSRRSGSRSFAKTTSYVIPYGEVSYRIYARKFNSPRLNIWTEEFFGKYANPGFNFSLGGHTLAPSIISISLKSGPVTLSGGFSFLPRNWPAFGAQIMGNMAKTSATVKYQNYFTLTAGSVGLVDLGAGGGIMVYGLGGITKARYQGQHTFDFKFGMARAFFDRPRTIPYFQLCYSIFAFVVEE